MNRLLLVPAVTLVAAQYAVASDFQTLEQAQQRLYPGVKLTPADFKLTPEQFAQLKAEYKVPSFRPQVKAWRVEGGGWLFLDQVYGLNDVVTYLVGIGDDGRLRGLDRSRVRIPQVGHSSNVQPDRRSSSTRMIARCSARDSSYAGTRNGST